MFHVKHSAPNMFCVKHVSYPIKILLAQGETLIALRSYFRALSPIGGSGVRIKKDCARLTWNIPSYKPPVRAAQEGATADLIGVRHPGIFSLHCRCDA